MHVLNVRRLSRMRWCTLTGDSPLPTVAVDELPARLGT